MKNIIPLTPHLSSAIIAEDEVTIGRLSALLETAFIDHIIDDDGDLYITDGVDFPLWVTVVTDRKLICLCTCYRIDDEPGHDWLSRVNDMNWNMMVAQFNYHPIAVTANYWMIYEDGLNVRQFIKMLRAFSSAFREGLMLHDGKSRNVPHPSFVGIENEAVSRSSDTVPASPSETAVDAE